MPTTICPYCNQEHPTEAAFCPNTGKVLTQQELIISTPASLICPHCQQPYQVAGAKFCLHCGKSLTQPAKKSQRGIVYRELPPEGLLGLVRYVFQWVTTRNDRDYLGYYVEGYESNIPNAGLLRNDLLNSFLKYLEQKQIQDAIIEDGYLMIRNEMRPCYFVSNPLERRAKVSISVRVDVVGSDLIVRWGYRVLPPLNKFSQSIGNVILSLLFALWMSSISTLCSGSLTMGVWGNIVRLSVGDMYVSYYSHPYYDIVGRLAGALVLVVLCAQFIIWATVFFMIPFLSGIRANQMEGFMLSDGKNFQIVVRDALTNALIEVGLQKAMEGRPFVSGKQLF
jgi:uncharacterized membrane protein